MPNSIIKSFAKKYEVSKEEVETIWKRLKKEYGDNYKDIVGTLEKILEKQRTGDTSRELTGFNHLKIDNCILTAESVDGYLGRELGDNGAVKLKNQKIIQLDPNKIYYVYRDGKEIEKALNSYNNVPLTNEHYFVDDINANRDKWLGTVGSNAVYKDGKVYNSVALWCKEGVDLVHKKNEFEKAKSDLSAGYSKELIEEQGVWNGKHYDFKMCDLECNHVALVDKGRVEVAKLADNSVLTKECTNMEAKKLLKYLKDHHPRIVADAEKEIEKEEELIDNSSHMEAANKGESTDETEVEIKKSKDKKSKDKKAKDKKSKDKKAKDLSESYCDSEEENETEVKITKDSINELVRQQLAEYNKTKELCEKVIGRANFSADASPESMMNATLKMKNVEYAGYSLETKQALLKQMATDSKKESPIPLLISDSVDSFKIINL